MAVVEPSKNVINELGIVSRWDFKARKIELSVADGPSKLFRATRLLSSFLGSDNIVEAAQILHKLGT